ncbi:MAG: hypothetical protein UBAL2_80490213 [Leptospirillum rubarum]|uniref:Uncharacterized protein n=1 Tax=Leptospirillum sp. Group II '5-way CG' TaxID=419541 RepID=B6ART6_9BACT|nr:MAG: hypothetical protein UBAL2_80490213 [Leptospirillum rubarum]EDZ38182.1 MAG: Hypothetical protein CGL2_06867003 [Leptospirillum sp. Group II '5-way CG']
MPSLPPSLYSTVGQRIRTPTLSVPELQTNLWSADEHSPGGTPPQGPLALVSGRIRLGRVGPEGGPALGINKKDSFNRRHRFLALPSGLKARQENGSVEAGEIWFLRSCKGWPVESPYNDNAVVFNRLTAVDRSYSLKKGDMCRRSSGQGKIPVLA